MQRLGRMKHELSTLKLAAMIGISVWNVEDDLFHLQVSVTSPSVNNIYNGYINCAGYKCNC